MSVTIPNSLFVSVAVFALMVVPAYLVLYLFRRTTRNRKSPLNIELLRSPGQSLGEEISELTIDIIGNLLMIPMVALIIYTVIVTNQLSSPEKSHLILVCFGLIAAGGVCLYLGIKAYGMFKHRNALSVGYECELAVGQDFTQKTALETTQEKILTSLRERPTLISIILPVLKLGVVIQSKIKKK